MKTVTSHQMRQIELRAASEFGVAESTLMENAGHAVANTAISLLISRRIPKNKNISVFCGAGNNGGDGFVAARFLKEIGFYPEIILVKSPELLRDTSLTNFNLAKKAEIQTFMFSKSLKLTDSGLIVDSLLGTGIKDALREPYLSAIEFINSSGLPVVAVDVPSGLCADSGLALGAAVKADITVTMGIAKTVLVKAAAKPYVGELQVAPIGLPMALLD